MAPSTLKSIFHEHPPQPFAVSTNHTVCHFRHIEVTFDRRLQGLLLHFELLVPVLLSSSI